MSRLVRRLAAIAPVGLGAILPTALLCAGVARFMLQHFFVHAPFMLDSGWFSAIVYRAGLLPRNPRIACDYAEFYYGVHFSPLLSAFSVLSYVAPLPRLEWYAAVQAALFAPFGIAVYMVARAVEPSTLVRRAPTVAIAALCFSLSGQVLSLVAYPHYEAAIPGLIILMLATTLTGRGGLGWMFLILAATVREDAGLHAALALSPVLYLKWRGTHVPVATRTILRMVAFSIAFSILGIAAQRLAFSHSMSLLNTEYFGTPFYGHLSWSLLASRTRIVLDTHRELYYPLLAAVVLALLRRDPGYLLGWLAAVPWLVVNVTAFEPAKGVLWAYTGFPFLVSTFWVYLYGAVLARPPRRLPAPAMALGFAIVASSSTLGLYSGRPRVLTFIARDMLHARGIDRAAVHELAARLGRFHGAFGKLYVDGAVASVALESLQLEENWYPEVRDVDTIAFHRDTTDQMLGSLIANHLPRCLNVTHTGFWFCTRLALPPDVFDGLSVEAVPAVFAWADRRDLLVDDRGVSLTGNGAVAGRLGRLPAGRYRLSFTLAGPCAVGAAVAALEVRSDTPGGATLGSAAASCGTLAPDELAVEFDATAAPVRYQLTSSTASPLGVTAATIVRR